MNSIKASKPSSLKAKYKSEKGNKCRTRESTVYGTECTKERWLERVIDDRMGIDVLRLMQQYTLSVHTQGMGFV